MHFYVSESLGKLSSQEVLRLQKSLRVILKHESKPERLKATLHSLYGHLQNRACLEQDSFHRLLEAGGILAESELVGPEKQELAENPFVVWPSPAYCCVAGEALESLKKESQFLRDGYLFAFISRLAPKEIKAWGKWLARIHGLPRNPSNGRELYRYLLLTRLSRKSEMDCATELAGKDLKVILRDDVDSPMHWFYRGVLPFYRSLDDLHGRMEKEGQVATEPVLRAFLYGDVISFGEITGFGQPLQYRVVCTREKGPSRAALEALGGAQEKLPDRAGESTPSLF
ncbi:MAG: hypothetical protein KDK23_14070 [Leptospiraceae bacterium]|nr:hypothetical protein [Leptospiraceae bacterium]